jgi:CspA family cold shock protein
VKAGRKPTGLASIRDPGSVVRSHCPGRGSFAVFAFYLPPSPILLVAMLTGTVKFFNDTKGFGFIIIDDTQEEIFVHQTGLIHEIQEGDRVQFNVKAGKKGPNAIEVTRIV